MRDGEPAFNRDDSQGKHRQVAGKDGQKSSYLAAQACAKRILKATPPLSNDPRVSLTVLPVEGIVEILAHGMRIDGGNEQQVEAQAQVGKGKMTNEEAWH